MFGEPNIAISHKGHEVNIKNISFVSLRVTFVSFVFKSFCDHSV